MYEIGKSEIEAVAKVIRSGRLFRYGGGKSETAKFEKEWTRKIGTKHAISVTSGTGALICGVVGLGVGPGDEVIVPAYTFMASALAPLAVGAIPVVADVDESLTIDPKDVERKITRRTKAIMPVHMCGWPSNMAAIMRVARKKKVDVIEDACQAVGGSYRGKRLGSIGKVGGFSFNVYKNITAGEGGAVVTNDQVVYERALIHHDGGCVFRPHAAEIGVRFFAGWNFRTNEIASAILRVQLRRLDGFLRAMRRHKKLFVRKLSGHPRLPFMKHNDLDGDCGSTVGFIFEDVKLAEAFEKKLTDAGVGGSRPINSGRHVYTNWEPVMKRRGAHHRGRDAYRLPANRGSKMRCTKDMCARSLDILARTVVTGVGPKWTKNEVERRIRVCERAAEDL